MATAHDVAAYILSKAGAMTAMKLQKLVYYSHAWHLVWEERPLFADRIEAWANGPVVRSLYDQHRGHFGVSSWQWGDAASLTDDEKTSIDAVIEFYGKKSAHELSELTHREAPWLRARGDARPGARSDTAISDADMHEYYDGLTTSSSS